MVDYMAANSPVPVDYTQRSVGVSFPDGAPATYAPGDTVAFALSSLAFTAPLDVRDAQVSVALDGAIVGLFAVDNTIDDVVFDEHGTAAVSFAIPAGTAAGAHTLTITGLTTGTTTTVPLNTS
jgi:5'-nucleotidase